MKTDYIKTERLEPMLSAHILDQDKVWRDAEGRLLPLESMDARHRQNLIPFLIRHGENLRFHYQLWQSRLFAGCPDDDLVDGWEWDQECAFDRPFLDWLTDFPLVQRLMELYRRSPVRVTITRTDSAGTFKMVYQFEDGRDARYYFDYTRARFFA